MMVVGTRETETLAGFCEARSTGPAASLDVTSRFASRAGLVRVGSASMAFSRRLDINSSGVDHIAIHVVTSGTMMWRQVDSPRQVGAGSVVLTDLASEFGCASGENRAEWTVLLLNRHQVGSELLAPLSDRPTILDAARPLVLALHAFMADFSEALRSRPVDDPAIDDELNVFGDAVTNILQGVLRNGEGASSARIVRPGQSKVLQICRHIDEDLASPNLAPETLARHFGLSRASLYRMFEPLGGVARYIRLQKIARAAVQLQKGDARIPLSAIAESSGFSSADAFVRAFRESYGTTPRDYRAMQATQSATRQKSLAGWLERNYFWKTNAPRPGAGAQMTVSNAGGDYATAASTAE